MKSKIETYIGFAIKKGSVVFGCDNVAVYKKKMYLLLATESLSDNSYSVLENVAVKRNCPLKRIADYLILANRNCKALAVCDKSLADAILSCEDVG
ncbi:MAG: hypothetical protein NC332_03485 [Firmicutes bacterium]|nr:hypothetical protein [Bacillota bacterium]